MTRLICNPDVLQLPDRSLEILSSCPNINFLILTPQGSEVLQTQPAPACWSNLPKLLAHLPELTCIDISNCGCTDTELEGIAGSCAQLQGIDLSFNPGISDTGIEKLLGRCKQLQELDLSNCCSLSSRSLLAVAEACSSLNTLYLEQREVDEERCDEYSLTAVTAQGLYAIAKGCPALKVSPSAALLHGPTALLCGCSAAPLKAAAAVPRRAMQRVHCCAACSHGALLRHAALPCPHHVTGTPSHLAAVLRSSRIAESDHLLS